MKIKKKKIIVINNIFIFRSLFFLPSGFFFIFILPLDLTFLINNGVCSLFPDTLNISVGRTRLEMGFYTKIRGLQNVNYEPVFEISPAI